MAWPTTAAATQGQDSHPLTRADGIPTFRTVFIATQGTALPAADREPAFVHTFGHDASETPTPLGQTRTVTHQLFPRGRN